jgi:hypothetical protein
MEISQKPNTKLPSDPASHFWEFIQRDWIRMLICTPKFIAALFTIAKIWKPPKCSWYLYTMEYSSLHFVGKEIQSFTTTMVEQDDIVLSEINQAHKDKYYMISII